MPDDHVRVKLEVYIGDLDKFEELLPDAWLNDSTGMRPSLNHSMNLNWLLNPVSLCFCKSGQEFKITPVPGQIEVHEIAYKWSTARPGTSCHRPLR